jgi:hypothetical protein
MPKFLFGIRRPADYIPGDPHTVEALNTWFDGMGAKRIDPGHGVVETSVVGNAGQSTRLGGYLMVTPTTSRPPSPSPKDARSLRSEAGSKSASSPSPPRHPAEREAAAGARQAVDDNRPRSPRQRGCQPCRAERKDLTRDPF